MERGFRQVCVLGAFFILGPLTAYGVRQAFPPQEFSNPRVTREGYIPDLTGFETWSSERILEEMDEIQENPQLWDGLDNFTLAQRTAYNELSVQYRLAVARERNE